MQITTLLIYTEQLEQQSEFYSELLGFTKVQVSDNSVSFKIGQSILKLEQREGAKPYHFAITIPANQSQEALVWLKERVAILKKDDIEIHAFDFWNAEAIYFYDADKNIVEFIARKNLDNASEKEFDVDSLIEISEIGLPTLDIEQEYAFLQKEIGLGIFSGSTEMFCAIGDEQGLIICINKTNRDWFPLNDRAYSADFELQLTEKGKDYHLVYQNEKLSLASD